MSQKALIISLNFNPGHVSHLVASYKQCKEIGFDPIFYVNPNFIDFLPSGFGIITSDKSIPKCDFAIFLFPSIHNLILIFKLKRQGTKVAYIFHEPLAPLNQYRKAGFSYSYLAKLWLIDHISAMTIKWSDIILLPSKKAVQYYQSNSLYKNKNASYMPLLYDDELIDSLKQNRKYISYIGTIAADHSFDEFIAFVKTALKNNWFEDKDFLIATKSDFQIPEEFIASPRVKIKKGRPLTNEEINDAYSSSAVIWNAYIRTTQSGVLAKSYMFGTPAIALKKNLNEFMIDGGTVITIDDNKDASQIKEAVDKILYDQQGFIQKCREFFLKTFYYRNYNDLFKAIIK